MGLPGRAYGETDRFSRQGQRMGGIEDRMGRTKRARTEEQNEHNGD